MKHLRQLGNPLRMIVAGIVSILFSPLSKAELVAWWDFDQPAPSGVTLDSRGGQRAVLLGGALLTPDGEGRTGVAGDSAARFGTGAQRLQNIGNYFTGAFAGNAGTISFWIKHTALPRASTSISFVAPSVAGARGWQTHAPWSDGTIYSDSGGCCDGTMRTAGPMGAIAGTWHHVALVRGPNIDPGEIDRTNKWIYVDGTLIASGTNDASIAVPFTQLIIGNSPGTTEAVNGDIDDVAIYSHPLSAADAAQLAAGMSPLTFATAASDSDGDGLPDLWEQFYAPGDLMQLGGGASDLDMDGLTDTQELTTGTNPNAADTDNDGLADNVESGTGIWMNAMDTGTNPFVADTDADTLLDGVETNTGVYSSPTNTGTNPHLADTDGDLTNDALEITYGSSPVNPASTPIQPGVPTLLAWWPFNDASNPATATDTRAGIVATMVAGAGYTADAGGRTGLAGDLALNTAVAGDGLRANLTSWLNIATRANKMTVMFWQRNNTNPQASSFWMNSPAPGIAGRGMQAHVPWSDNRLYYDHAGTAANTSRISVVPAVDWTQWHHFAFVKDGGKKVVYIDGVVVLNQDAGAVAFPTDFNTLFIGYNGAVNSVNGQMDDFAVFASGVGADDIMSVASGAKTPLEITQSSDADGDGLPDSWEYSYFPGDLTKLGMAPADFDMDGSTDAQELARTTDPTDDDSDDDGLLDGPETKTGVWVSAADTGTDPLVADTDGDSLRDDAENCSGLYVSPTNPGTNPNLFDTDMDGFSDSVEGPYGADPNITLSIPFTPGESFLLAYWNFNDANDPGIAKDVVIGRAAAVTATYSAPGGGASGTGSDRAMCYAPGQNVLVNANFVNLASPGNKLTISFWQKLNSTTVQSSSFWIRSPSSTGTQRGFQAHSPWSDGNIYFDHSGCCTAGVNRLSGPIGAVDATQWRHYAFVKDGNTKTVYIDGVPILTGNGTAPLANDFSDLQIGNGAAAIDGCLDEFAIFAGALDMEQIARLAGGETADTILSPPVEFKITDFQFNPATKEFTVTWNSMPNRFYGLYYSFDLLGFGADISDSIMSGGTTTTYGPFTLPFAFDFDRDSIYFLIQDASP